MWSWRRVRDTRVTTALVIPNGRERFSLRRSTTLMMVVVASAMVKVVKICDDKCFEICKLTDIETLDSSPKHAQSYE